MSQSIHNIDVIVRRLRSIVDLTAEEERAVGELPMHVRELRKDQDIIREGDRPSQCLVLLQGFTCRYKTVAGGKRQIFSFQVPGDMPDLTSLHLSRMDHDIGTLSRCEIGFVPHSALEALMVSYPSIARGLWRDILIESATFREWMVGMGRRPAYARIAHLFCEVLTRLAAIGHVDNMTAEWPITQEAIGDALGLSTVHVNRVVQALRGEGLIMFSNGVLQAIDWQGLKKAGDFDPAYLHLRRAALP